jgi:outer membrane protein with beta-barrel domain
MRIFLLTIVCLCSICVEAQWRIGIQGGYNRARFSPSSASTEDNSLIIYTYTTSPLGSVQIGIVTDVQLASSWLLRSGVMINGKGTRFTKESVFSDSSSRFVEVGYLEVPLTMVHQWKMSNDWRFVAGAGVYAARALRGVEKGEGVSLGGGLYGIYNFLKFRTTNPDNTGLPTIINPFDYGFILTAGIEHRGIQFLLSYGHGLQQLFPTSLVCDDKFTTRVLSISAAYLFKITR